MSPRGDLFLFVPLLLFTSCVCAHQSIWDKSMFGFNVTREMFPYDNRPVAPLANMFIKEWWFHGHLDYPPNPGDIKDLPAGQKATFEISCDKGATSYWASSPGYACFSLVSLIIVSPNLTYVYNNSGDVRSKSQPNYPCPGQPTSQFHTLNQDDVTGCALSIAYKSDAKSVILGDLAVFSVNHMCVWTRFTDFEVSLPIACVMRRD